MDVNLAGHCPVLLNLDAAVATCAGATYAFPACPKTPLLKRSEFWLLFSPAGRFLTTLTAKFIMALLCMALSRKFSSSEIPSRLMVITPAGLQNSYAVAEGS
jgi:hypothetical protein